MNRYLPLIIFAIVGFAFSAPAEAKTTSVRGYFKPSTGRYVMPSYKTTPNKTKFDNFSTKGNFNPFTGKAGKVDPFKSTRRLR